MKQLPVLFISFLFLFSCTKKNAPVAIDFTTTFENSIGTRTATYEDVISFYKQLAATYPTIAIYEMGPTDSGKPLHVVVYNPSGVGSSEFNKDPEKNTLLINNGIHPGESDGIDASMMLLRDYAQGKLEAPKNTVIATIPVYNIGGALNRNTGSRTNQNGPEEYGFRGNARNFDLNRDFMKVDTKNAESFQQLFHQIKPAAFIDNHVSNGADYQYTLTHLFTQHNKLGDAMGSYLHETFHPALEDSLAQQNWDITPYVNLFNRTPEHGFSQYLDSPRYSTGYTTLFNALGMMIETHMLKPYKQRVEGTYALMRTFVSIIDLDAGNLKRARASALEEFKPGKTYPLEWAVDSSKTTTLQFKGYEGRMVTSEITGLPRLKYFRDEPFVKPVTYYNYFKATDGVIIPDYYIIPQGYWTVIDQLKNNCIKMEVFKKDTVVTAEMYTIQDYSTYRSPYEGHYPHYDVKTLLEEINYKVNAGDILVPTEQDGVRYIIEALEPTGVDSFFAWNYFDTILQQKEGFSPYVWEDKALELLEENPLLKSEFEAKKASEADFANNWYAQLDWLHKRSNHYEKSHLRYPIVRVR